MATEPSLLRLSAGQIVLADWRVDARPKEPNKLRPGVVVEDDRVFPPDFWNVLLVPLTEDASLAFPNLSVAISPTPENGCPKLCWAASSLLITTAKVRIQPTQSRIMPEQLDLIRRQIAFAIGIGPPPEA